MATTSCRSAAQAIERYAGHVAQYQGDAVMAYFGWPQAHDNEAERAARAGLAILDAMAKLNEYPTREDVSSRRQPFGTSGGRPG
jgi:class 3 adenylate cyclase